MSAPASAPPDDSTAAVAPRRPSFAHWVRRLAGPIILFWLALTVVVNVFIPQLEQVGQEHSVSMSPPDAPSTIAMKRIGKVFKEFDSNSTVMVLLEGDQPLDQGAHDYYDALVRKLEADRTHVEHVEDFWSDPLTAAGSQSSDGKAAYVQIYLAGNQGEALANESVRAVQSIVASINPPPGVKAYVTGNSAVSTDTQIAGDHSLKTITLVTFGVIFVMLLLVYRSIATVLIALVMVLVELAAARGVVAFLAHNQIIGLSTFAVNLLTLIAIAAATDYVIFLVGRYQEARAAGEDRESAYYTMFHGTAHVILGSGLTIAGATFCLHFTTLPYFQSLGIPLAVGTLIAVSSALTLGPSVILAAGHFGLLDPKVAMRTRGWRRIGTIIVRWPGPVLITALALALVGLVILPTRTTDYNDRNYLPNDIPANVGYTAAERHFSSARLNPELLMIESDHDLRNPADFLIIDRIAKAIFHEKGFARVQSITRPLGTPIDHSSIPFQISLQNTSQELTQKYNEDQTAEMLKMANELESTIATMKSMYALLQQLTQNTHDISVITKQTVDDTNAIRDHIADFDDFFRPIRSYFYWEPHCFDIPACQALRSIFDTLDGIDTLSDDLQQISAQLDKLDTLLPEMLSLFPSIINTMENMHTMTLTMHNTMKGLQDQQAVMSKNATAMGQAFDAAKNDDSFYLPPEAFDNPNFKRGLEQFLSADGHAVRFIIAHDTDPMSPEGIAKIDVIKSTAVEAMKGTPMEGSKIYLGGPGATYKDMQDDADFDLLIAGIAALCLIFVVMLVITRAIVASVVIVSTVLVSLGTSVGLSVLIWQDLIGRPLHWMVIPMSVIILLAVGSDYNLLLVSRFKEEIHAGLNTGIIRAMGGSGSVVTSAGLVFAVTMCSFAVSDLRILGQIGTTIGLGLIFDTMIIRSFLTPSVAALLGPWFWWPRIIRRRAPHLPPRSEDTQPIPVPVDS